MADLAFSVLGSAGRSFATSQTQGDRVGRSGGKILLESIEIQGLDGWLKAVDSHPTSALSPECSLSTGTLVGSCHMIFFRKLDQAWCERNSSLDLVSSTSVGRGSSPASSIVMALQGELNLCIIHDDN